MRELIYFILKEYDDFFRKNQKPSEQKVAKILTQYLPEKLLSDLELDKNEYKVVGSYGMGNKTQTPWVSIFNRAITEGAQKGFYVVYLFRKDMSGVYLSLNQGTTYLQEKFKGQKPREKMKEVAKILREELIFSLDGFSDLEINLRSSTGNAKNYEAANIYSKFYKTEDLPDNDLLLSDLRIVLKSLLKIKEFIGIRNLENVIDDLIFKEILNDAKYQEDIILSKSSNTPEVPQDIPQHGNAKQGLIWKRNAAIAKEAIAKADYTCEIDKEHITFTSSITNKNFVEAHHLIPMSNQGDYNFSLDVPGNIVSLCPNCHRKIHHATSLEKQEMLKILFKKRESILQKFGIQLSFDNLLKAYGI